jgi:1,4-alpha-glucan branching enzyme
VTTSGSAPRAVDPLTAPLSVYELNAGSWRQGLGWRDLADELSEARRRARLHARRADAGDAAPRTDTSGGYKVTGYFEPPGESLGEPDDYARS